MLGLRKAKPKVNATAQAHLIRLLVDDPHTVLELAEETGLSEGTVRAYLRALHKRKLVYIVDKVPDSSGQRSVALWAFGVDKRDKFKAKSQAERQAACRARKNANLLHSAWLGAPS